MIPDVNSQDRPDFTDAERSVLADDIKELKIAYTVWTMTRPGRGADVA